MHVSKPKIISQGLVKNYTIEFSGIKTDIEIHLIQAAQYGVHDYIAYVIDQVPDWTIMIPLDQIVDWIGSGVKPENAIKRGIKKIGIKPTKENLEIATNVFNRWFNHYGALTPLLLMDDITDIYINKSGTKFGLGGIYLEHTTLGRIQAVIGWEPIEVRKGKKVIRTVTFDINTFIDYLIRRIAMRTRTAITAYNPAVSVVDPEFGVRLSVEAEPVNPGSISVRVLPKKPWTLPDMVRNGMINTRDAAALWLLAEYKVPQLYIGPMGSGKTSLQNAVAYMLVTRSMALIMDVAELFLPHHNIVIPMFERVAYAHGIRSIDKAELIRQALRSGADIIVLNEARSRDEFKSLAEAITLGHGALTTFHAEDYEAAKVRLTTLGLEAEELLKLSVVVEVGKVTEVRYNSKTGVYEVVTRRFVKRINNADYYLARLAEDYGADYVNRQLNYREDFLAKAAAAGLDYQQLANLLYIFYKAPEQVLKGLEQPIELLTPTPETETQAQPQPELQLPEELLQIDSELNGSGEPNQPFKENKEEGGGNAQA